MSIVSFELSLKAVEISLNLVLDLLLLLPVRHYCHYSIFPISNFIALQLIVLRRGGAVMIRTETKTSTQTEITMSDKKRRAIAVSSDIERINTSLAGNSYQDLKGLHIELDGTYQTVIKNWDVGMWGFFKGHGFNYECLDESSIRDNLAIMQGKLRGYMLQLDPGADSYPVTITTERRVPMTTQQKKLLQDYGKIKTCCMGNMAINI